MTNTEIIQAIKAEIERQRKFIEGMFIEGDNNFYDGQDDAYNNVLSFLSTLESEKPMNQDGFSKEFDEYFLPKNREQKRRWGFADIFSLARHFAEWGAEHRGISETPNDLEEAAGEYEKEHTYQRYDGGGLTPMYDATLAGSFIAGAKWQKEQDDKELSDLLTIAHLQGAEQMKEQMLKEAVEGEITKDNRGNNVIRAGVLNNGFEIGDKVRIIILKQE